MSVLKKLAICCCLAGQREENDLCKYMPLFYIKIVLVSICHDAGQECNLTLSYYQGQALQFNMGVENQANKEPRAQLHEQNMQIGNRHNQLQMTSEVIEQKFLDGILKLAKEQSDAEDVEIARHREVSVSTYFSS